MGQTCSRPSTGWRGGRPTPARTRPRSPSGAFTTPATVLPAAAQAFIPPVRLRASCPASARAAALALHLDALRGRAAGRGGRRGPVGRRVRVDPGVGGAQADAAVALLGGGEQSKELPETWDSGPVAARTCCCASRTSRSPCPRFWSPCLRFWSPCPRGRRSRRRPRRGVAYAVLPAQQAVEVLPDLAAGQTILAPSVAARLAARASASAPALSAREIEILGLLVQDRSNRDIAGRLFLSEATVMTVSLAGQPSRITRVRTAATRGAALAATPRRRWARPAPSRRRG